MNGQYAPDTGGVEPKCVDLDILRGRLVQLAEQGDLAGVQRIVEGVLGRQYRGTVPLHEDYAPTEVPCDKLPETGCHVKGKAWTASFRKSYPPGYYLVIAQNPKQQQLPAESAANTTGLPEVEWRNASGKQPAPPGFEKKNCQAEYDVVGERYAMKGVCFYRNSVEALARWNLGLPLVLVFHVSAKEARMLPRRESEPLSAALLLATQQSHALPAAAPNGGGGPHQAAI